MTVVMLSMTLSVITANSGGNDRHFTKAVAVAVVVIDGIIVIIIMGPL